MGECQYGERGGRGDEKRGGERMRRLRREEEEKSSQFSLFAFALVSLSLSFSTRSSSCCWDLKSERELDPQDASVAREEARKKARSERRSENEEEVFEEKSIEIFRQRPITPHFTFEFQPVEPRTLDSVLCLCSLDTKKLVSSLERDSAERSPSLTSPKDTTRKESRRG